MMRRLASAVLLGSLCACLGCGSRESSTPIGEFATAGPLRVKIVSVRLGKLETKGSAPSDLRLLVEVVAENTSPTAKLDYNGWNRSLNDADNMVVVDEFGNKYDGIDFGSVLGRPSLYPGASRRFLLVFKPPVDKATQFTCRLPLNALSQSGWASFSFPLSAVARGDMTDAEVKPFFTQ